MASLNGRDDDCMSGRNRVKRSKMSGEVPLRGANVCVFEQRPDVIDAASPQ